MVDFKSIGYVISNCNHTVKISSVLFKSTINIKNNRKRGASAMEPSSGSPLWEGLLQELIDFNQCICTSYLHNVYKICTSYYTMCTKCVSNTSICYL